MKTPKIPIEPRAVADGQAGARWAAREGAPLASRLARTISAEYDNTPRGKATRLVALVQARLEPDNMAEQVQTLAAEYEQHAPDVLRYLPRALQMQAVGALITSDHLEASKAADRRESARVKTLAALRDTMPEQKEQIDAALLDLWASTLHTDAEQAVWRNLRKHAAPLADAIKPYKREIRRATCGSYADSAATYRTDSGDVTANVWNAARVAFYLAQIAKRQGLNRDGEGETPPEGETPKTPEAPKPTEQRKGGLWKPYNVYGLQQRRTHPNGALGRRWRPTQTGKTLGRVSREITDPSARVFRTRTSGRGGTIVVDCSGSMALRREHLDAILNAAGGATVWGYTSEREQAHRVCCLHLLAHNGKRVREIPDDLAEGGDNGIDGEALRHALKHHRKGEPFIWITDGGVTGANGRDADLVNDCRDTMRKARGLYAYNHAEAVRLLKALARGARPRTDEPYYFQGTPTA